MRTLVQKLLCFGRTRAFDAAGGGRRWKSVRTVDGLNAAILAGATTAARRAGWYARNNPWVAAAVDSLVGNIVGAGIKPQSTHPDRAVRERLQALWLRWTDEADAGGLADFHGLQAMAVRAMIESGESFIRLRVTTEAGSSVPLSIELLDREQVPVDLHREIGGGARIRAGIEFDPAGRRVAYRVLSSRPGDPIGPLRMEPVRVPAADCLHLFKPLAAGQLRGITWLAPVLLRLHELDQFEYVVLDRGPAQADNFALPAPGQKQETDAVGSPTLGPWNLLTDECRADYAVWESFTVACSWYQAAPHNRTLMAAVTVASWWGVPGVWAMLFRTLFFLMLMVVAGWHLVWFLAGMTAQWLQILAWRGNAVGGWQAQLRRPAVIGVLAALGMMLGCVVALVLRMLAVVLPGWSLLARGAGQGRAAGVNCEAGAATSTELRP